MLGIEWKKIWKNKFMVVVLIAIVLIPSIYAIGFLKSMWDPYGKIKDLPVAVINEDKSVHYQGNKLAVGAKLKDNLADSDAMKFSFPSQKEAKKGLSNGKYYMVMTIPKNFSKNATTLLDAHGADVKIMDRFFRHRELPDSENFSKPGFQLKTA
ncbi:YhgE/Pip domain-containing protein [Leuconostoc mesenteroides]|uniref:YhgE/Pip domain-containing protein n=1 Tax=Leuconostoc mesenteroides TaxID=1245 RepID=UPI00385936AE